MFELLDRLRSKPEHYKRVVAVIVVSIITGFIFFIWAVDSLTRLSQANLKGSMEEPSQISVKSASVFFSLKDQLGTIFEESVGFLDSIRGPIEYDSADSLPEPLP